MDKIENFRKEMIKLKIDAYIIPTCDYHNSEYVSDHFKARGYLSGFTGSAGTLLITLSGAYLWTDGRYFIQAEEQIKGTGIELMKMREPGVPTLTEFIKSYFENNFYVLGFDGKVIPTSLASDIKKVLPPKVTLKTDVDLIGLVWKDRPKMPFSLLYKLEEFYTGKSMKEKIELVRERIKNEKADAHILAALEDQAWLYNLRANDVSHTPVFLAFTMISQDSIILFIDEEKVSISVEKYLEENGVVIKPYNDIYSYAKNLKDKKVLIDSNSVNYQLYACLNANNNIIFKKNPTLYLKAVKNPIEIKNIKDAHIKDGVAMVKFMYWLKTNFAEKNPMSEISISDYLEKLRRENKSLLDLSFTTICAFNSHGAMMHYSANQNTNYEVNTPGFLLVDSGGHYREGTTDITRTFALGKISDEMKVHFTTALKSMINLATAVFLKGCTGQNLDVLARQPIWKLALDYKCGTGHGVGNVLSVHEGPNGFRWQNSIPTSELEPGMITTDEPGIYLEGRYGIRHENELLCVPYTKNDCGEFYAFETITYVPFDLDGIKVSLLTKDEKAWLNNYHQMVYDILSPYLTPEENEWLKNSTKSI